MQNFLLRVGVIALVLYLLKSGTDSGARAFQKVTDWGRGMVAQSNLDTMSRQLKVDCNFDGQLPGDFRAWVRDSIRHGPEEDPSLDFWGTPYVLERDVGGARGAYVLRCCGPDKLCPSRDDATVSGLCKGFQ